MAFSDAWNERSAGDFSTLKAASLYRHNTTDAGQSPAVRPKAEWSIKKPWRASFYIWEQHKRISAPLSYKQMLTFLAAHREQKAKFSKEQQ